MLHLPVLYVSTTIKAPSFERSSLTPVLYQQEKRGRNARSTVDLYGAHPEVITPNTRPTFRYFHFGCSPLLLAFFLFFFSFSRWLSRYFITKLNRKPAFGHKDALYRKDKTIRFIFFTALHVTPFMGKVHIHFDMTYTKMISDYQSWFIIATLFFPEREGKVIKCMQSISGAT